MSAATTDLLVDRFCVYLHILFAFYLFIFLKYIWFGWCVCGGGRNGSHTTSPTWFILRHLSRVLTLVTEKNSGRAISTAQRSMDSAETHKPAGGKEMATIIHLSRGCDEREEKEERHFICHTTAEPSSGWRESTDSSSPFSSPPPPPQKGKTKISPQKKKKKKRTSDGILLLLYFDKVKIPRWGVSSSTPMPAQSVHIYKEVNLVVVVESNLFFLLLVILFVPWSLTGAAIFNDEWTERRKWENQPAQHCASTIETHTQTRIHTERAIIAYQHARYIQNKQTWLHIVYNLN